MTFILACLTATFEGFLKRKKHKCLERRQHDPGELEAVKGGAKGRGSRRFRARKVPEGGAGKYPFA